MIQNTISIKFQVQNLLKKLTEQLENPECKLKASSCIIEILYELRRMNSSTDEVKDLLNVIAVKIKESKQELSGLDISKALFGLKNMHSEDVSSIMEALMGKIAESKATFSPLEMARSLMGIRNMKDGDVDVLRILNLLDAKRPENLHYKPNQPLDDEQNQSWISTVASYILIAKNNSIPVLMYHRIHDLFPSTTSQDIFSVDEILQLFITRLLDLPYYNPQNGFLNLHGLDHQTVELLLLECFKRKINITKVIFGVSNDSQFVNKKKIEESVKNCLKTTNYNADWEQDSVTLILPSVQQEVKTIPEQKEAPVVVKSTLNGDAPPFICKTENLHMEEQTPQTLFGEEKGDSESTLIDKILGYLDTKDILQPEEMGHILYSIRHITSRCPVIPKILDLLDAKRPKTLSFQENNLVWFKIVSSYLPITQNFPQSGVLSLYRMNYLFPTISLNKDIFKIREIKKLLLNNLLIPPYFDQEKGTINLFDLDKQTATFLLDACFRQFRVYNVFFPSSGPENMTDIVGACLIPFCIDELTWGENQISFRKPPSSMALKSKKDKIIPQKNVEPSELTGVRNELAGKNGVSLPSTRLEPVIPQDSKQEATQEMLTDSSLSKKSGKKAKAVKNVGFVSPVYFFSYAPLVQPVYPVLPVYPVQQAYPIPVKPILPKASNSTEPYNVHAKNMPYDRFSFFTGNNKENEGSGFKGHSPSQ